MRRWIIALAFLLVAGSAACGEPESAERVVPEGTISREQFIATYVELRYAVLESGADDIEPGAREEILRAQGVTAEDLFRFLDVYGTDVAYMRDLWQEIADIIELGRTAQTSTS